jgi:pimeloyl-ACP methyl ester carboxylesterase
MSREIDRHRRSLLMSAAMSVAVAELSGFAQAQSTAKSFAALRQIDSGLLNVGYAEAGPLNGAPVILLHGWPYDIHSFVDVAPLLASAGYRVIVPYLRGYGSTRFLSSTTFRNGQQSAVALDIIALMDALKIQKPVIGGFDWGARTANIIAALWPERCKAMVSVSGYLVGTPEANKMPLPPQAEFEWWYQYYFVTERGRLGYEKYRREFSKLIWQLASPKWNFDDATFERSAAAFENPDHVAITIHNYRWRLGLAPGEARYDELEGSRQRPLSPCPRSRSKATPTVRRTRTRARMRSGSPALMRIDSSPAASGTTCRRRRPRLSPRPSKMSIATDLASSSTPWLAEQDGPGARLQFDSRDRAARPCYSALIPCSLNTTRHFVISLFR